MRVLTPFRLPLIVALGAAIHLAAANAMPTVRTAHDSIAENATSKELEGLVKRYDLRPWTFTNDVIIDEHAIPHSHPVLTLHTRHLNHDDELLSAYLHEQLHWFLSAHPAETQAAEDDLMKLYPDVPVGFPDGAQDRHSTYLHLLVCTLEQHADDALLGPDRTAKVMNFWAGDHYRWVYRTVLNDGTRIEAVLKAHHLDDPRDSPRPQK